MEAAAAASPPRRPVKDRVAWAVLVGLFAVAVIYILVAVPRDDAPRANTAPTATPHSDGLSERHDGYTLEPLALPTQRGGDVPVAFRILDPGGSPVTGYATVQAKPLHMYVAREDLSLFQHVHPRLVDDTWRATVDVPDGGVYRLYVEFTPAGRAAILHPTVLGVRFIITGDTSYVPLPAAAAAVRAGPYTVRRLDGTARQAHGTPAPLRLQVLDGDGRPVTTLQPYLGAFAHISAFDVFTQAMTHVHAVAAPDGPPPADGVLAFHTVWSSPGAQRVFVEFQVGGTVQLAAFTVVVT